MNLVVRVIEKCCSLQSVQAKGLAASAATSTGSPLEQFGLSASQFRRFFRKSRHASFSGGRELALRMVHNRLQKPFDSLCKCHIINNLIFMLVTRAPDLAKKELPSVFQ